MQSSCTHVICLTYTCTWVDGAPLPMVGSSSRRRKTLNSNPRWLYPLIGKAKGVNPYSKSGVGVPKADRFCPQRPSGSSCDGDSAKCIGFCPSFGPHHCRGEGDMLHGQQLVPHTNMPRLAPWRGQSSSAVQRLCTNSDLLT